MLQCMPVVAPFIEGVAEKSQTDDINSLSMVVLSYLLLVAEKLRYPALKYILTSLQWR